MEKAITVWDVLKAFEPTGFSSDGTSVVLGTLAAIFVTTLVSLFFYMLLKHILPTWRRANELEELLDILEANHPEKVLKVAVWDNEIKTEIDKYPWLASQWKDFRGQCWIEKDKIHTFVAPDSYFNYINPPPVGFSGSVPNMLTAFGILGTFIGIVIGLAQIGGQMGGESSELQAAMGNLIGSLGVSFRTSIWGLIFSVLATILNATAQSKLESQEERWLNWLEHSMSYARINDLAVKQLSQAERQTAIAKETIGAINSLGDVIAISIAKALGEGELMGTLRKVIESIHDSQEEGLELLVAAFMKQMTKRMGNDFGELGKALRELSVSNKEQRATIQALIKHLETNGAIKSSSAKSTRG